MMEAVSLVGQLSGRAGALMNSSEELIARARRGEDEAFRMIFDRYGRPIISFIYDMVGHRETDKVGIDDDRVIELSDGKLPPDRELLDKELNGVIRDALGALDEDKRLVFTLKIFQQRSYEEISEITGSSIPKLKTDLHRARAEMRRRIQPYLGATYEV